MADELSRMTRRSALAGTVAGLGTAILGGTGPSFAQGVDKAIQAGAAKEGKLTLLLQTSATDESISGMIKRFRQHYPFINVTYTLQSTSQVMNRFTSEINAKRGISDCLMLPSNLNQTAKYVASGAVAKYVVSQDAAFPAAAKQSGMWYAQAQERTVTVYRKGALNDEEKRLIRTFKGLGNPRFKGRLGINGITNSVSITGSYVLQNAADKSLWPGLAANKPRVKTASPALMDGLLSGEYDVSIFASYASAASQAKNGAPIEFGNTDLVPTLYVPSGISALAPQPNAARLWQDWAMSKEGQDLWVTLAGSMSSRSDVIKTWAQQQPWFFDNPPTHKPVDWTDFAKKEGDTVARFKKDMQAG